MVIYILRFLLTLASFALWYGVLFPLRLSQCNHTCLIGIGSEMDIFHNLFYAMPVTFLLMLISRPLARSLRRAHGLFFASAGVLALAAGAAPLYFAHLARPKTPLPPGAWMTALYVMANVMAAHVFAVLAQRSPESPRVLRLAGIIDALFPLGVWSSCRETRGRRMSILFLLPASFLCLLFFIPWLARPVNDAGIRYHAAFSHIAPSDYYQVFIDPLDHFPIVSIFPNELRKFDPATGKIVSHVLLEPHFDNLQGFGPDPERREIRYVDPCAGVSFLIDMTSLKPKSVVPIANRRDDCPREGFGNRTQWDPATGTLITFNFIDWAGQIDPSGERILAKVMVGTDQDNTSDAVIDPERRLVHWVAWKRLLYSWDVDKQRFGRSARLASVPDRIALDEKRGRLFLPLPLLGKVEVIDAGDYHRVALFDSFPGVRVPTVDQERGRLYLGGLSPYLEIRSLDDYSLIDRILAPPWMRWIAVDNSRGRAFVTGTSGGISLLDLARLDRDKSGAAWRRRDPFIPLLTHLIGLVHDRIDLPCRIIPCAKKDKINSLKKITLATGNIK